MALVITIVVLLILAGVSIIFIANGGLFEKAKQTVKSYNEEREKELLILAVHEYKIQMYAGENLNAVYILSKVDGVVADGVRKVEEEGNPEAEIYNVQMESGRVYRVNLSNATIVIAEIEEPTEPEPEKPMDPGEPEQETEKPTGEIMAFTEVPLGISAIIRSSDAESGVDYEKCKYVLTENNEEIGEDERLYVDGIIKKNNETIKKSKRPGTYYLHVLIVDKVGNKKEIVSDNSVEIKDKIDFYCTKGAQNVELLPGKYKFECWGAQGGSYSEEGKGGLGGYTSGIIELKDSKTIYCYVGGTPENSKKYLGGYNGGGNAGYDISLTNARGGGGSTDFRVNDNDVTSRIMVAAGGGGSGWSSDHSATKGNDAGGLEGYGEHYGEGDRGTPGGSGGTQVTAGYSKNFKNRTEGSFSQGGNGYCESSAENTKSHTSGGGGSGYYGGGGGISGTAKGYNGIGGGGSSYISGHIGCKAINKPESGASLSHKENSIHFSEIQFITETTVMIDGKGYKWTDEIGEYIGITSPNGETETGHIGDGHARITNMN